MIIQVICLEIYLMLNTTKLSIKRNHFNALWLSDIHLGNKDCKAEFLLDFLQHNSCDTLYLVGDIIDMWQMSKQFRWPDSHNKVLHELMRLSHSNTKVIYLPGNHDAPLQQYDGMNFGDVEIRREAIHQSLNGKSYMVMHGDQFDQDVTLGKLHAWVGDKAYDALLWTNRSFNKLREWQNGHYWSLAGYIKSRIKGANKAIFRYKVAATQHAKKMGYDGLICGHIHHPEKDTIDGIEYINDGDWIENCTALAENQNGELILLDWAAAIANRHNHKNLAPEESNKNVA